MRLSRGWRRLILEQVVVRSNVAPLSPPSTPGGVPGGMALDDGNRCSRDARYLLGASFEVICLGRWWDSLEREQWPADQEAAIIEDFEVRKGPARSETGRDSMLEGLASSRAVKRASAVPGLWVLFVILRQALCPCEGA